MIECQVNYFLQCVQHMRAKGYRSIEVKPEAVRRFVDWLEAKMPSTAWQSGCASWYLQGSENAKGGRNLTMWPGPVTQYWWETRKPKWEDFIFTPSSSKAEAKKLE
jgi:hypothetical protein